MLVQIRPGVTISGPEQEFVECLRKYPTTGVAMLDLSVGDGRSQRQIDAVIWTPRGITVVDVEGFKRRQSGILSIPAEGDWKISDATVELDAAEPGSPADRLEQGIYVVQSLLERALDPGHVCGAVVLVPFRGVVVRPARTNLRPGIDVVVGNTADAMELRIYLEGFSAGPRSWTADRVIAACRALGVAEAVPTREELIADGFDEVQPETAAALAHENIRRAQPTPGPATRGQKAAGWAVLAAAIIGLLVMFGVVANALARDTANPSDDPGTSQSPSPTTSPAPVRPTECYPFQQTC